MDFNVFIQQYGLFFVLAILLVFMIFSTRRRNAKMKADQEQKQRETVPGARVLMQGGLYGTIVEFDAENLDQPARVEIAPGVVIDVHSQAILRIVTDQPAVDGVVVEETVTPLDERPASGSAGELRSETAEETRARLERDSDDK